MISPACAEMSCFMAEPAVAIPLPRKFNIPGVKPRNVSKLEAETLPVPVVMSAWATPCVGPDPKELYCVEAFPIASQPKKDSKLPFVIVEALALPTTLKTNARAHKNMNNFFISIPPCPSFRNCLMPKRILFVLRIDCFAWFRVQFLLFPILSG